MFDRPPRARPTAVELAIWRLAAGLQVEAAAHAPSRTIMPLCGTFCSRRCRGGRRSSAARLLLLGWALCAFIASKGGAAQEELQPCTAQGLLDVSTSGDCLDVAASPIDGADFCRTACYTVLGPFMDRCQGEL
eukprot:SAG31_NODE_9780_length_1228_cov_1.902569_1_plen_132_part_10